MGEQLGSVPHILITPFGMYKMVLNSVAGITQGKGEIGKEFTKEVTFALNFRGKRNVLGRERQMANLCNNLPS